jgi:hypothetical protein
VEQRVGIIIIIVTTTTTTFTCSAEGAESMKRIVLAVVMVLGCASAPGPRAPDESHRVPVNRGVPPEAVPDARKEQTAARKALPNPREVEWR